MPAGCLLQRGPAVRLPEAAGGVGVTRACRQLCAGCTTMLLCACSGLSSTRRRPMRSSAKPGHGRHPGETAQPACLQSCDGC